MDEEIEQRLPLPNKQGGEMMAIVDQHMGGGRLRVICEDGKERLARIPGKIKKRKWIKIGDLLIVKPWDFQNEKADVIYRYTPTQIANLDKRNLIPDSLKVFL
ncbi:MAG: translation initiation factor IF-1A [Thermoplasmata archaeon]|nr:MAG: translation initiation factor IF-1A [Thermoplasmata archaeon]KAA0012332.1 MAG: translation initiation factor IF-1A [Thermoplasmata archaeon]